MGNNHGCSWAVHRRHAARLSGCVVPTGHRRIPSQRGFRWSGVVSGVSVELGVSRAKSCFSGQKRRFRPRPSKWRQGESACDYGRRPTNKLASGKARRGMRLESPDQVLLAVLAPPRRRANRNGSGFPLRAKTVYSHAPRTSAPWRRFAGSTTRIAYPMRCGAG